MLSLWRQTLHKWSNRNIKKAFLTKPCFHNISAKVAKIRSIILLKYVVEIIYVVLFWYLVTRGVYNSVVFTKKHKKGHFLGIFSFQCKYGFLSWLGTCRRHGPSRRHPQKLQRTWLVRWESHFHLTTTRFSVVSTGDDETARVNEGCWVSSKSWPREK